MFDRELTLYKFNLKYLRSLVADLTDDDLKKEPFPGGNPPVWILGHLAVSTDYAGRMLGLKRECPREWHAMFGPTTKPADLPATLPNKEELVAAIESGHRRVAEAAAAAPPEVIEALARPHAIEILKQSVLKTNGDVLAHLLCTHAAFHLAQLSACRRSNGKPPLI
jgi:hypothetical protein